MVNDCCVVGCHSNSVREKTYSFYRMPAVIKHQGKQVEDVSRERRMQWITAIRRENWLPNVYTRICSKHFHSGKPADLLDQLNPDWVPALEMGYTVSHHQRTSIDRFRRSNKRQKSLIPLPTQIIPSKNNVLYEHGYSVSAESMPLPNKSEDSQPENISKQDEELNELRTENEYLRQQNGKLMSKVADLEAKLNLCDLTSETFESDDKKVTFYTGLPTFSVFQVLLNLVTPYLNAKRKLTVFQQLLLFLMKMRLGLFDQDLAYRFGIHQSTASRIFADVLTIVAAKTAFLIHWPDRDSLHLTMPQSFRQAFKKCAVIIDCTEIFVERPSNLLARAQVWSNYKHHSTLKFLIGITPQCSISFISSAWGGRASDKVITEDSELSQYLLPGDVILADRGFLVGDYAGVCMAEVITPPFTKGKKQLSRVEVDFARELSAVRIHVERVIGMVKRKYTILQGVMPLNFITQKNAEGKTCIDKIVQVACALCNLCPQILSDEK